MDELANLECPTEALLGFAREHSTDYDNSITFYPLLLKFIFLI